MVPKEPTIISTGCDWITGVATDETTAMHLSLWVGQVLKHQERLGNVARAWGMAGFTGWSIGECQIGKRGVETIVRLSGEAAYMNWRNLYSRVDNITRLDWQVTYRIESAPRAYIRGRYRAAERWSNSRKHGPNVTLVTGTDGGDTLYLGKRQSEVMARLYNKGVESKLREYAGCVRAEVEYKGKMAKLVSRRLNSAKSPFVPGFNQICTFFRKRGCDLGLVHDL